MNECEYRFDREEQDREESEDDQTDEINAAEREEYRRMMEFRRSQEQYARMMSPFQLLQQAEGNIVMPGGTSYLETLSPTIATLPVTTESQQPNLSANNKNLKVVSDESLIQIVKQYQILWGTSGKSFKDTERKNRC